MPELNEPTPVTPTEKPDGITVPMPPPPAGETASTLFDAEQRPDPRESVSALSPRKA